MQDEAEDRNKIMIVDDDPDILYTLRMLFENEEFEVITVENGRECLRELERGFKGIIILDLMMPVMDGAETIKNMIMHGFIEHNTIIVLTAKRVQDEEFNEIYPFIYEFITKPFDIYGLFDTVEDIIENRPLKNKMARPRIKN